MNIYGDTGNIITLKKRAQWRGIEAEVKNISISDRISTSDVDIFFFGGGQDQQQELVARDLQKGKGKIIKQEVERGVPLLAICGGYQLLGEYYQPHKGPRQRPASQRGERGSPSAAKLPGVGLFPAYTVASHDRMIGNIVIHATSYLLPATSLVGFENHSGKTYLKKGALPFGMVVKGFGNNGEDKTEGCIYKNAIGCYMHGSLLPKNPHLTDWLIQKALETKYGLEVKLKPLNDELENKAHQKAIKMFT